MIAFVLLLSSLLRTQCWVSGDILNGSYAYLAERFCRDTVGTETLLRLEDINEQIEVADVYGFYVTTNTANHQDVDAVIPLDMVIHGKGSSPLVYIDRCDAFSSDGAVIIETKQSKSGFCSDDPSDNVMCFEGIPDLSIGSSITTLKIRNTMHENTLVARSLGFPSSYFKLVPDDSTQAPITLSAFSLGARGDTLADFVEMANNKELVLLATEYHLGHVSGTLDAQVFGYREYENIRS